MATMTDRFQMRAEPLYCAIGAAAAACLEIRRHHPRR